MKESAEIACSYVAANLDAFDGDPAFFDQAFVHLHVPEGLHPRMARVPASRWPPRCCPLPGAGAPPGWPP